MHRQKHVDITTSNGYPVSIQNIAFGTIFGVLAIAGATSGAIGPVLCDFICDTTGAYSLAFVIFAISMVIAAIAILQARPSHHVDRPF